MKELVILLSADLDIQRIHNLYEDRQEGRGAAFLEKLEGCFRQLRSFPESAPLDYKHFRRLMIPKSPFAIYYVNHPHRIAVRAVHDVRLDRRTLIRHLSS